MTTSRPTTDYGAPYLPITDHTQEPAMIRDAVTCDRTGCMALYIEPVADPTAAPGLDRHPTRAEDVLDFEQLVDLAGWVRDDKAGHTCPACAAGRGPVLELGECPKCTGRTTDTDTGAVCQYCRTITPHTPDPMADDPDTCPECGGHDFTAYSYDAGQTTTGYECRDCEHNWRADETH